MKGGRGWGRAHGAVTGAVSPRRRSPYFHELPTPAGHVPRLRTAAHRRRLDRKMQKLGRLLLWEVCSSCPCSSSCCSCKWREQCRSVKTSPHSATATQISRIRAFTACCYYLAGFSLGGSHAANEDAISSTPSSTSFSPLPLNSGLLECQ